MITGDIDLTENLDFRKTVKRKIPKFPKSWGGVKSNIERKTTINITRTTNNIISQSINTVINNNNSINVINYYGDEYDLTISSDIISYNTNTYVTFPESTIWFDGNTIKYIDNKKPIKNVFGEIVNQIQDEYIPKIPWNTNDNKYKSLYDKRIPWRTEDEYRIRHDYYFDDDRIPWDCEDNWYREEPDLSTKNKRAKSLICWLNNKSLSFIRDYFNKQNDESDLKYLTDMSWIRITDAIID